MVLSDLFEGVTVDENYGGEDAKIFWESDKKSAQNEMTILQT